MEDFRFIQTASVGGDCTAPYDIQFFHKMTVGQFINEILKRREWGSIYIYDTDNKECGYTRWKCCCSFNDSGLDSGLPEDILCQTIKSVTSSGGWSRMDYYIVTEGPEKEEEEEEEEAPKDNPMKMKTRVKVDIQFFPEFVLEMEIPEGKDKWKYINDFLDAILTPDKRYNCDWEEE